MLTENQVLKLWDLYRKGTKLSEIARKVGCTEKTVKRRVAAVSALIPKRRKKGSGRRYVLTPAQLKKFKEVALKYKHFGAKKLQPKVNAKLKVNLRVASIKRYLRLLNLRLGLPRKVPALNRTHKQKRLEFARQHENDDLRRVIFSDEKMFYLWFPVKRVRYEQGQRPEQGISQDKRGVMVWFAISKSFRFKPHFIEGTLNGQRYLELLQKNLAPVMGKGAVFQQDNAPSHKDQRVVSWLQGSNLTWMDGWPPCSPDLSPIENMWAVLGYRVALHDYKTLAGFKQAIRAECAKISQAYINRLIDSFHGRLRKCIDKGGKAI